MSKERWLRLASEARATFVLALPVVVAQLLSVAMNVADTVLAGHLDTRVLAAVAMGYQVWVLALLIVIGLMLAVTPAVAQLDGAGRRAETGGVLRQALWIALALSGASAADDVSNERVPKQGLDVGKAAYLANCAACHQPEGVGMAGAFPPLAVARRSRKRIRRHGNHGQGNGTEQANRGERNSADRRKGPVIDRRSHSRSRWTTGRPGPFRCGQSNGCGSSELCPCGHDRLEAQH